MFCTLLGKIRGLIPYQPQYKYQEPLIEDVEANVSQCHHCDTQIRHVIILQLTNTITKYYLITYLTTYLPTYM